MSDDNIEITGDTDEVDIIDYIENDINTIAFGLDSKMRSLQCHYTILKTRYKKLAYTWLIATFIGYSYFLKGAEDFGHLDHYLIFFALSLLSSIGLYLLYFLDIGIYQQMAEAVFLEAESLEKKFPFLGATNKNIMSLLVEETSYPLVYEAILYGGFTTMLLVVANVSLFFYFSQFNVYLAFSSLFIFFALIILLELSLIFGFNFFKMSRHVQKKFKKKN